MRFAVVEFMCDKTCSVIQETWIDVTNNKCFFPPTKSFSKYVQKEIKDEKLKTWNQYDIKIIRDNFETYDEANEYAKYTSEFGDTEGELETIKQKQNKRKQAIFGDNFDLRSEMKRSKIENEITESEYNYGSFEDNIMECVSPHNNDIVMDAANIDVPIEEITMIETINVNKEMLTLIELKQFITETKTEILQKIEELKDEINNINVRMGQSPLKNIEKIDSKKMFKTFIKQMENQVKFDNLIHYLKTLPDLTKSKNPYHGKIATMIENLFTTKFIQRLKWGEMNGLEPAKKTIFLVNYPIFVKLANEMIGNATAKEIRNSFQIYFKHRAKKFLQ